MMDFDKLMHRISAILLLLVIVLAIVYYFSVYTPLH